jgi:hypothetical protein
MSSKREKQMLVRAFEKSLESVKEKYGPMRNDTLDEDHFDGGNEATMDVENEYDMLDEEHFDGGNETTMDNDSDIASDILKEENYDFEELKVDSSDDSDIVLSFIFVF